MLTDNSIVSIAHDLFGFKIGQEDFVKKFLESKNQIVLENVAIRMRLINVLRYRTGFRSINSYGIGFGAYYIDRHLKGLELYLLCTCIDALAGEDFIDFPQWLRIGKKSKANYGLKADDEKFRQILGNDSTNLTEPDVFRKAASEIYKEIYTPRFGNHKAFLRFFESLPNELKELLTKTYFISDLLNTNSLTPGIPTSFFVTSSKEYQNWNKKNIAEKIVLIANYFYQHRRNTFTHRAVGWESQVFNDPHQEEGWSTSSEFANTEWSPLESWVKEGNKYRAIWFKASHSEDEAIIFRLIVSIGYLKLLGYDIATEFISEFRNSLMLREVMYQALYEIEDTNNVLKYYSYEKEEVLLLRNRKVLPNFPTHRANQLKTYKNEQISNLMSSIDGFLNELTNLNSEIAEINLKYSSLLKDYLETNSEEKRLAVQTFREQSYQRVHLFVTKGWIVNNSRKLYEWLNMMVDKTLW